MTSAHPDHEAVKPSQTDEDAAQLSVPDTIRRLSTAQLLSLLTSAILMTALGIAVAVTARSLRQSAILVAQDRLDRGVRQLALVSAAGIRQSEARYRAVAGDSAVRRLLAARDQPIDEVTLAAVRSALSTLVSPTDSGMPLEVWSAAGRRLAFVGEDIPDSIALRPRPEIRSGQRAPRPGLDSLRQSDSLQVSTLYESGNRTDLWVVLPIVERGRTLGFIAQHRWITANPQVEQTIRSLSGDSVSGYYRNADGSMWTSFGGIRAQRSATGEPASPGSGGADSLLFAEETIAGTPLVLGMQLPLRVVETATENSIRRLGLLGALLTVTAAVLAWLVGRVVAKPIVRVTNAAALVAGGDYSTRVPSTGTWESTRLADSFNQMAAQIGESRLALESREEALREARDSAEMANRAKMDFLAAMSHELRTPLNAIGGYTEIIEMGLHGPVTNEQREDLSRIRANQRHLLGLISGILDLSRLETGRVTYYLEPVELDPLLVGLEALVAPQAASKQQVLDYKPGDRKLAVHADAEKVKQIVLNLLSNAIRHSPPGSAITVETHAKGDKEVAICVADTGPGIPLDRRESVFEPFVQLDRSLTGPSEGVGLGLAISRDLARGMGGDLTVDDGDHQGARFTVMLPRVNVFT